MEIYRAPGWLARRFLRTSSRKEGSVQNGQRRSSSWIRNGNREYAGVLVVDIIEVDAVIWAEPREPKATPVEQVVRYSERNSRTLARKRCVSHHIAIERLDKRYTRILTTTSAVGLSLVVGLWFQGNADSFDPHWVTSLIKPNSRYTDPRIIASRNQPREEVELTIRTPGRSGIQDSPSLKSIGPVSIHQ
jgi:hypothetical protein